MQGVKPKLLKLAAHAAAAGIAKKLKKNSLKKQKSKAKQVNRVRPKNKKTKK